MITPVVNSRLHPELTIPPALPRDEVDAPRQFVRADPPAAQPAPPAPHPLIKVELDRFQREQEKLRAEYLPKIVDLAADKAVPGGAKEMKAREAKVKETFDKLDTATKDKWPLVVEQKLKTIDRVVLKVTDILDATGQKPITDIEVIKEFRSKLAAETGMAEADIQIPPDGLTRDAARFYAVTGKAKLYNLKDWDKFEFKAMAVSGWLGSHEGDLELSKDIPEDVRKMLEKDPNLKEKRDIAISAAKEEFGGTVGALDGVKGQMEKYKNIKGVYDAYAEYAIAAESLDRGMRQVDAAMVKNGQEWMEGDTYPEFKATQKEFIAKRNKAFEDTKGRVGIIVDKLRKEEAEKRIK